MFLPDMVQDSDLLYVWTHGDKSSVHRQFQAPWKRREGAMHASRLELCLVFSLIVFQATPDENLWPSRSKSVRSQVSKALFYVWTVTLVRMRKWICTDDTRTFRLHASKGSAMVSQSPGLPDLLRRPSKLVDCGCH